VRISRSQVTEQCWAAVSNPRSFAYLKALFGKKIIAWGEKVNLQAETRVSADKRQAPGWVGKENVFAGRWQE
jgi:hypothetical protein